MIGEATGLTSHVQGRKLNNLGKLSDLLGADIMASDNFAQAITHRSVCYKHNERMEFLGDSILGVIISVRLYQQLPDAHEGYLSRLRASLVNENALADIAFELSLGDYVRLGPGELKSGGFRRKSILADAMEAIIGCVYLEKGMESVTKFVLSLYKHRLENLSTEDELKDPKSRLQEYLQSRKYAIPLYKLLQVTGEAHRQTFMAQCQIESLNIQTTGVSTSRRKAEQDAAAKAFEKVIK